MNLVIVESPTKAKTITKFLGSSYKVESSFGHVRDLPAKNIGVDIEKDFQPKYVILPKSKKNLSKLKELGKKADTIILATDEDREGEAIAWHLAEAMNISEKKAKRIVFHEITKDAILSALENPRQINYKLVDAQQARRILDRLVGYKLSPFLWKKVAKGLSAGRVQSVAVRMIVEREREIQAFKPDEYWTIETDLIKPEHADMVIKARLHKIRDRILDPHDIKTGAEAKKIIANLAEAEYIIKEIDRKQTKKNPPKPFTTSSLQQTANRWLGFSAKQTMVLAQQLYEGIEIAAEGSVGLITYMRTDSFNLSEKFLAEAQAYLKNNLGEKYATGKPRRYKTKAKGAQEAHEAIRVTDIGLTPEKLKESLNKNQWRLYQLIWQRSLASQMPEAIVDATAVDINAKNSPYVFRATGQTLRFDGYLKIYPEKSEDIEMPPIEIGDQLKLLKLEDKQHFTKPPARYSDAGLVKAMERYGIGRPSTYAPTIATIEARNYVVRDDNKKLMPTEIAFVVNDVLVNHFQNIVDFDFTARMEDNLDKIATGETEWTPVVKEFYGPFSENLEIKYNELKKENIMPEEKSNEKCDKCGAAMIIKTGRYGKFLACSAFPDCRNIKSMNGSGPGGNGGVKSEEMSKMEEKYNGEKCEKCGSPMAVKSGRYGLFLACSNYPKCKNIKNIAENGGTGIKCPVCGEGDIVQKRSRKGVFYACNKYPDCKTAFWGKPTGKKCPECEALLVEDKNGAVKCSAKGCGYSE